jgi:hypothetical protein
LQVIFPLRYETGVASQTISAADIGLSTLKYAGQENYVGKEQLGRVTETVSYFHGGWMGSHNFKVARIVQSANAFKITTTTRTFVSSTAAARCQI